MFDIVFLSETWLNSDISCKEILPYWYDIYRTDRSLGRSGEGVLIATKHDAFINCSQLISIAILSLDDYFMTQLCLTLTRESNIPDLLITNQPEQISSLDVCTNSTETGMTTDYKVIRFMCCKTFNTIMSNKWLVYDYKRGNFDDLRKRLL